MAKAHNVTYSALGDETPDFLAAAKDLTAESCQKMNEMLKDPEGVYIQSVGSVMSHPRKGQFPLNLSYRYVKNYDGDLYLLLNQEWNLDEPCFFIKL